MKQLEKRIDDTWRCKRDLLKQIDQVETNKKQFFDIANQTRRNDKSTVYKRLNFATSQTRKKKNLQEI